MDSAELYADIGVAVSTAFVDPGWFDEAMTADLVVVRLAPSSAVAEPRVDAEGRPIFKKPKWWTPANDRNFDIRKP